MPSSYPDFDVCLTCMWVRCAHSVDGSDGHDFRPDYMEGFMDDLSADTEDHEEPEGGWVTSPTLATEEILSVLLCKYTAEIPNADSVCQARMVGKHANVDCLQFYVSGAGIQAMVNGITLEAPVVTINMGDITQREPL